MPISVRLDKGLEAILEKTAKVLGTTRAEILRRSIREFCLRTLSEKKKRPYELIQDLVGKEASGLGDLSLRGEEILREYFRRKK